MAERAAPARCGVIKDQRSPASAAEIMTLRTRAIPKRLKARTDRLEPEYTHHHPGILQNLFLNEQFRTVMKRTPDRPSICDVIIISDMDIRLERLL